MALGSRKGKLSELEIDPNPDLAPSLVAGGVNEIAAKLNLGAFGDVDPADPVSVPGDIAGVYFAVRSSDATPSYFLVPDISLLKKTGETIIDTGMQTTTGIKETRRYKMLVPCNLDIAGKFILYGKSGALNSTASANNAARINLNLEKNGGAITGVTKVNGIERIPNNTAEVNYDEVIAIDLLKVTFSGGDSLDIVVELEITVADANGIQLKLYSDPATSGNELIFYLQVT